MSHTWMESRRVKVIPKLDTETCAFPMQEEAGLDFPHWWNVRRLYLPTRTANSCHLYQLAFLCFYHSNRTPKTAMQLGLVLVKYF